MKIETCIPAFSPVTLTLETEADVRFFRDVIGCTSFAVDQRYGIDSKKSQAVFAELDAICSAHRIERPVVDITIEVN